jgi:hypothetical protein
MYTYFLEFYKTLKYHFHFFLKGSIELGRQLHFLMSRVSFPSGIWHFVEASPPCVARLEFLPSLSSDADDLCPSSERRSTLTATQGT